MHFLDVIILLVLVVVIYAKLKGVLGTRPEVKKTKLSEQNVAKIFDIIIKEAEQAADETVDKGEIQPNIDMENMSDLEKTLFSIPNFDKDKFINNSKKAFELILTAFSAGDTETLKDLLNPALYKKFKEVIDERKKEGLIAETEFIGFEQAEIKDAKVTKNLAKICIKFVTEQVNILKNARDEVIEGDANFIQNITDIWTFEKNINSTGPKWLLASTKK
ncbi:MAG: Tim44/TimA family putative adaptor protein [Lactobacillaceae bacterium]|jgi:predicted lipid-binding transport protein (Tim44 family)|nr:Tim44/TimA family putative adaptor protein [Lactobacillaceae bacterium]